MVVMDDRADVRSRLVRLLAASVTSRLHLALVLVGRVKAPADVVLDLYWAQVDLDANLLLAEQGVHAFPDQVAALFYWHAVRQRLDALTTRAWPVSGRVFVNRYGVPFTSVQADAVLAHHWQLPLHDHERPGRQHLVHRG